MCKYYLDRYLKEDALPIDECWYAALAAGFAATHQIDVVEPTVGAGLIMLGPLEDIAAPGISITLTAASERARRLWGDDVDLESDWEQWTDRIAGLLILDARAMDYSAEWHSIGHFTSRTHRPDGRPVSEGWMQVLDGTVHAWTSQGPTVSWEFLDAIPLTDSHARIVDDLFPPGIAL